MLVASKANTANARYREINVPLQKTYFGLFRLRHMNESASITKATGLAQNDYANLTLFCFFCKNQNYESHKIRKG